MSSPSCGPRRSCPTELLRSSREVVINDHESNFRIVDGFARTLGIIPIVDVMGVGIKKAPVRRGGVDSRIEVGRDATGSFLACKIANISEIVLLSFSLMNLGRSEALCNIDLRCAGILYIGTICCRFHTPEHVRGTMVTGTRMFARFSRI